VPTKFHENLPIGSKVISEGHTDRQTDDLISLLSFFESGLKYDMKVSVKISSFFHSFEPRYIYT
jgi:hypothetical protein